MNFPNLNLPPFDYSSLKMPDISSIHEINLASEFHKRLSEYVIKFEKAINADEEVAIKLVSYGEAMTIQVEDMGYYNPSLITFYGTNMQTGDKVQLIQHVSQISFLLTAIKSSTTKTEMEKVGFKLQQRLEEPT